MAALKSNSTAAAVAIIGELAHELAEPKRLFDMMQLSPQQAKARIIIALENGDYDMIALIGLAQSKLIAS